MHPKYEFHEFCWQIQLGARFENQENHIKGESGDILDPRKNLRINPNYDFRL